MEKFEVEVIRTDKYQVEFDENIINAEWMENYRKYFTDIFNLKDHSQNIAQAYCRTSNLFIEGYGDIKINGSVSWNFEGDPDSIGINIKIISEDDDIDTTTKEV
jgi:hypothetical protein